MPIAEDIPVVTVMSEVEKSYLGWKAENSNYK